MFSSSLFSSYLYFMLTNRITSQAISDLVSCSVHNCSKTLNKTELFVKVCLGADHINLISFSDICGFCSFNTYFLLIFFLLYGFHFHLLLVRKKGKNLCNLCFISETSYPPSKTTIGVMPQLTSVEKYSWTCL